jgi:hypothetical protein
MEECRTLLVDLRDGHYQFPTKSDYESKTITFYDYAGNVILTKTIKHSGGTTWHLDWEDGDRETLAPHTQGLDKYEYAFTNNSSIPWRKVEVGTTKTN